MPLSTGQKISLGVLVAGGAVSMAYVVAKSKAQKPSDFGWLDIRANFDGTPVSASGQAGPVPFTETPTVLALPVGTQQVQITYQSVTKTFTALVEPGLTKIITAQFTSGAQPEVFTLSVDNAAPVIKQGQSVNILVHVTHISGDNKETGLIAENYLADGLCVFSQPLGLPSFNSILTIFSSSQTPVGSYTLTISATNPDHQESLNIIVTVEAGGIVGHGSISVKTYYKSLLDPVEAPFIVSPGDLTGTSPSTVNGLDPGYYVVEATFGGETSNSGVNVEANKTVNAQIIFTGQYA